MLQRIVRVGALFVIALLWSGCGGGSGSAPPVPRTGGSGAAAAPSSVTYALSAAGSTLPLPAAGAYGGSVAFPAFAVPAGATIAASASAAQTVAQSTTGTINVYYAVSFTPSTKLVFPTVPVFTIQLPAAAKVNDQAFYYGISQPSPAGAALAFRTEGPAAVSGRTLIFPSSAVPLTLERGVTYTFGFYGSASVATTTPSDLLFATAGGNEVLAFPAGAGGDVAPVRVIAGPHTGLSGPAGIAHDASGSIYVINAGAHTVTEYPADANGDVSPVRTIYLTNGFYGDQVAVDAAGAIYVGNNANGPTPNDLVDVYAPTASGNATPVRAIATGYPDTAGGIAIDAAGELVVSIDHDIPLPSTNSIAVFAPGANGAATPLRRIVGSNAGLSFLGSIALGPSGRIYTPSTLGFPNVQVVAFAANADGNAAPVLALGGPLTRLNFTGSVAVGGTGTLYIVNQPAGAPQFTVEIDVFAPGASGNVAPVRIIGGPHTGLAHGTTALMVMPRALAFP